MLPLRLSSSLHLSVRLPSPTSSPSSSSFSSSTTTSFRFPALELSGGSMAARGFVAPQALQTFRSSLGLFREGGCGEEDVFTAFGSVQAALVDPLAHSTASTVARYVSTNRVAPPPVAARPQPPPRPWPPLRVILCGRPSHVPRACGGEAARRPLGSVREERVRTASSSLDAFAATRRRSPASSPTRGGP